MEERNLLVIHGYKVNQYYMKVGAGKRKIKEVVKSAAEVKLFFPPPFTKYQNIRFNLLIIIVVVTMADNQHERAFQKQQNVFLNSKKLLAKKTSSGVRYYKNVGLGFKTPKEAIESKYVDKKCPFTSNVSIRGKILKGIVISTKMQRTIVVRRDYLHYVPKYNRYEKRHRNIPVHCSPAFSVKDGDIVVIGQCRPLCKTVNFNVLKVIPNEVVGNVRKQFMLF